MASNEINEVFEKIVKGVSVIGMKCGDDINGMSAAWVCRVSHVPPLVMVSIGLQRYSHDLMLNGGNFSVSILGEGQIELGRHFGRKSGRDVNKFADVPYKTAVTGAPIIIDSIAYMDCKITDHLQAGDHTIFVGEVLEANILKPDINPIIYNPEDYFS